MSKAGDKVTIYERHGRHDPRFVVGVTTVVEAKVRVIKTADGRRWQTRGMVKNELDARGGELGTASIAEYREGDEARAERQALLNGARRILQGTGWEVERDFDLLTNEDLALIAGVAERLHVARKARRAEEA